MPTLWSQCFLHWTMIRKQLSNNCPPTRVDLKTDRLSEKWKRASSNAKIIADLKAEVGGGMAGLTYLGDVCVLWNSVIRYKNQLIYTYSGLFCIANHPYKRVSVYTLRTI